METRILGGSGLTVSAIGLGCNNFGARIDLEQSRKVVARALDLGVTFFDTADVYGVHWGSQAGRSGLSEDYLGQSLGERRKDVVICTKFGLPFDGDATRKGGSRRHIMRSVEESLKRLRTDWIDLYQIHRPDLSTPIEETLRALDDLVRQGKVRYIGCSGFAAWRLVEAQWTARHNGLNRFVALEDEYSLLSREIERDLIPLLGSYGLSLLPYYPLAAGMLTGKYQRNTPQPKGSRFANTASLGDRFGSDATWEKVEKLGDFASARGHTLLELAMSWLVRRPAVASVIAGATSPEQIEQNVAAANWVLSEAELAEIDTIVPPGQGGGGGRY